MAGNVADYFAVGKGIGEGFARRRFTKGLEKLEEEYGVGNGERMDESRASEFDQKVQALSRSSGAARRGLTDDTEYLKRFRDQEALKLQRLSGAAMASGDMQGGTQQLAAGQLRSGDVVSGMGNMRTADTMGALGANPNDKQATNTALGAVDAKYGDRAGVEGVQAKTTQFIQENMKQLLLLGTQGQLDGDRLVGKVNGILSTPGHPYHGFQMRETTTNDMYALLDPEGNQMGAAQNRDGVMGFIKTAAEDPSALYDSIRGAEAKVAGDDRDAERESAKNAKQIRYEVIKGLTSMLGKDGAEISAKITSTNDAAAAAGFKFSGSPRDDGTGTMVQDATYNGKPAYVKWAPPDADSPQAGRPVLYDYNNEQINLDGTSGGSAIDAAMGMSSTIMQGNFDTAASAMMFQLQALDAIDGAGGTGAIQTPRRSGQRTEGLEGVRGVRNNNPGNIEAGTDKWQGLTGSDGRFATFETPEHGIRALAKDMLTKQGRGLNTVDAIINTYAPPSENDSAAYIARVSEAMGVSATDQLDLSNPETLGNLVEAIIHHENGGVPYSPEQISAGVSWAMGGSAPTKAPGKTEGALAKTDPKPKPKPAAAAATKPKATATPATARASATALRGASAEIKRLEDAITRFEKENPLTDKATRGMSAADIQTRAEASKQLYAMLKVAKAARGDARERTDSQTAALRRSTVRNASTALAQKYASRSTAGTAGSK